VARGQKTELFSDSALDIFQFRYEELDGIAARRAHHVVMRSAVQPVLIACHSILKIYFECQSTPG